MYITKNTKESVNYSSPDINKTDKNPRDSTQNYLNCLKMMIMIT